MNLLNKTAPWIAASLMIAASVFGDCKRPPSCPKSFEQGHELMQNQLMPAYNAPARIDVRGCWDIYATGNFTYWQPIQENMELGILTTIPAASLSASSIDGNWVDMDFDYKPGFQVGLGMNFNHDNWDTFAQYTWFRGHFNKSVAATSTQRVAAAFGHPAFNASSTGGSNLYQNGHEKWVLGMDLADLELARSYYVGTRLTFRPFFGARGAWIRQRVHTTYANTVTLQLNSLTLTPGISDLVQTSNSWGVGPRAGLYSNWMLGQGFRLFGNGFADILYTRYTSLSYNGSFVPTTGTTIPIHTRQSNFGSVRTHLDLEMGFGWGSYFDNNNWHVDFSAGYGFQVFFDQNMFRHFEDGVSVATSTLPNGNLYIQGLTVSARLDF